MSDRPGVGVGHGRADGRRQPGWTRANLTHAANMLRFGVNPVRRVYDSIGMAPFATAAPDWLNVGLWDGPGDPSEAEVAPRRLVERLARELPSGGVVLDVGNGLGVQDPVIADVARPRRLVAVNVTESQLHAGRGHLADAGALPVVGDATRLPIATSSVDGIISVEAAFHFRSRLRFFREARRVLRPGGVLSWSDVAVERLPRTPGEVLAGVVNARFWAIRRRQLATAERIVDEARTAGLTAVAAERAGEHTIDPFVRHGLRTLASAGANAPALQVAAARSMLRQWRVLRRDGVIDYLLLRAERPS